MVDAQRLSLATRVEDRKPTRWTEVRRARLALVWRVSARRNRARMPDARFVDTGFEAVRNRIVWRPRNSETTELAEAATVATENPRSSVRLAKRQNAQIQRARAINQRIADQPPLRALRCNRLFGRFSECPAADGVQDNRATVLTHVAQGPLTLSGSGIPHSRLCPTRGRRASQSSARCPQT